VTFVGYWARAALRRQWRSLLLIAALFALIGGIALVALAGARRTQSAYPRFLSAQNPSTMAVDIGGVDAEGQAALGQIAQLPGVERASAYYAFYVAPWVDGQADPTQNFEVLGSVDGRYFDQDIFTPSDGRRPDPGRADEVAVNEAAAKAHGYHVGQRIDLATVSRSDVEDGVIPIEELQPRILTHATIVGVGAFIEEVLQDDTDRSPLMLMTPAYVQQADGYQLYAWLGLILDKGDDGVPAITREITERAGDSGSAFFRVTSTDTFHALQAVRPVSLALGVFGLIVAFGCVVFVGQALDRHVRLGRPERETALAIGALPSEIALSSAAGPALAVLVGAAGAGVLAILASPTMPIGRLREFEVAPGIDVDWTVIGLGSALLAFALLAVLAVVAIRETPDRVLRRNRKAPAFRGALLAGASNFPATMAAGVRFAFEPGTGRVVVPVRSVLAGTATAVAALVAALVFGASLTRLVDEPPLFGWNWDVAIVDGAGYGNTQPDVTDRLLGANGDVAAYSGAYFGSDRIDGQPVPLLGMPPSSVVTPPIRSGRMVAAPGEIVLGTATIERLGKGVGDSVSSSAGTLSIVGTATLPSLGVVHGEHTSLGVGGIVAYEQLPGWDRNITESGASGPNVLFVRFRDGVDRAAAAKRLEPLADQLSDYNGASVTRVQRPAEIVNASSIRGASLVLGLAIAVAAVGSLALALTTAVRRRRHEFALLKAVGFTRRQVAASVAWQATVTMLSGLVIGVPVGVAAGRFLWDRFADQLDVVAQPAVGVTPILAVAVAALLVANLIAVVPALTVRRVPAALALRDLALQ
jgi:hypothetical protein